MICYKENWQDTGNNVQCLELESIYELHRKVSTSSNSLPSKAVAKLQLRREIAFTSLRVYLDACFSGSTYDENIAGLKKTARREVASINIPKHSILQQPWNREICSQGYWRV